MEISKLLDLLDTYRGRDKILKAVAYSTKCAAGLSSNARAIEKLDTLSAQASACRAVLRLLDDLPMLIYVLDYGIGKKEEDEYIRWSNVLSNAVDLLFYPIDHIAWAIDRKIINSSNSKWATASTTCWVISLYLTIMKSARGLSLLTEKKLDTNENSKEDLERISKQQKTLLINCLRASADIIYAVHYLPKGFLWSGNLQKWHVGALGSFSAFLGLYQALS